MFCGAVTLFQVVDHYENPRNVGTLDKTSKNVGTGLVGAPACGDVMKLQVGLVFVVAVVKLVPHGREPGVFRSRWMQVAR